MTPPVLPRPSAMVMFLRLAVGKEEGVPLGDPFTVRIAQPEFSLPDCVRGRKVT
jgi:hypothetical protein